MQALYAQHLSGDEVGHVVETLLRPKFEGDALRFAERLFIRALDTGTEADRVIEAHAQNWELGRIAVIDRLLLQMAITEMLHFEDIPPKVSINETIETTIEIDTQLGFSVPIDVTVPVDLDVPIDLVVDIPCNHDIRAWQRVLAPDGRYVFIGHDDFGRTGRHLLGSVPSALGLLVRSLWTPQLRAGGGPFDRGEAVRELADLLASGALTPVVAHRFGLDDAAVALRTIAEGALGRVVLVP